MFEEKNNFLMILVFDISKLVALQSKLLLVFTLIMLSCTQLKENYGLERSLRKRGLAVRIPEATDLLR